MTEHTEDVFGEEPDARQLPDSEIPEHAKLFRSRYRKMTPEELELHDEIKAQANVLAQLMYKVAPVHLGPVADKEKGSNVSLAIRHLEDAVYRAVKGLTA